MWRWWFHVHHDISVNRGTRENVGYSARRNVDNLLGNHNLRQLRNFAENELLKFKIGANEKYSEPCNIDNHVSIHNPWQWFNFAENKLLKLKIVQSK